MKTLHLESYPYYKSSRVEWLSDVPTHWGVAAVKRHYSIQLGKMLQNHPNSPIDVEVPYLKAQHVQWFSVRTTDAPKMWASPHEIEQFGIQTGDLLVCEGGEGGRCGLVEKVPPGYIIQNALHRVRSSGNCRNDYLQYVMNLIAQSGWFDAINNKATIAHFTVEKFGSLMIPFPPLSEQTAIVRYLDQADERIRRYISSRERLIELLEEYRQAVIHHAVTRGLDPDVRLKPSGVTELGDMPAHWEAKRLKTIGRIRYGLGQPPRELADGLPLIRATNVDHGRIIDKNLLYIDPSDVPSSRDAILREKEIIVVRSGAYTGDSAIVPKAYDGAITGYDMVLGVTGAQPEFVAMALLCKYVRDDQLIVASTRSAQPHLNAEELGTAILLVPPLHEQAAIVAYLNKATADVDVAIDRARREIELLGEYRTRLIADVVTGKVDVREAAHTGKTSQKK